MNLSQEQIDQICARCFGTVRGNEMKEYNRDFIDQNQKYIVEAYKKVSKSKKYIHGPTTEMYAAVLTQAKADRYYDVLMQPDKEGNEWAFADKLKNGSRILTFFVDILDAEIMRDAERGFSIRDSLRCTTEDRIELDQCWELDDPEWPSDVLDNSENSSKTLEGKPLSFLEKVLGAIEGFAERLSNWLEKTSEKDKKTDIEY